MKFLILWIYIIAISASSAASQTTLDLSVPHERIGHSLSYYEDEEGNMSFSHIARLPKNAFTPLDKAVDSHVFTPSTFWYRFDVINQHHLPLDRLIVVEIPWIDHIGVTVVSGDNPLSSYQIGNIYPYDHRTLDHRYSNFQHTFLPGRSTVYVQVRTRDPFIVPISVMDRSSFLAKDAGESYQTGFMYGFIGAMLLYNLFLFVSIKARYYAFYVLYLSSFLIMNMSYNGYTFKLFFHDLPQLQNWAQSTTIFLFSISGLLFARSFLDFRQYSPRLSRMTNRVILFFVATMLITPIAGYQCHVILAIAFSIFFSFYVLSVAFYSLFRGNRSAKFFILGTVAGLIGTSITAMTVMAVIPYSTPGFKAIDFGMLIDTILLSLALADRMRIAQEEKLIAEKEAKTDILTRLPNRKAYYEISSREVERAHRYGTNLSVIMLDIDYFKEINDTYGHSAGDTVLQYFAEVLRQTLRENDTPFRIGGEEFLILLPETDMTHAQQLAERIRTTIENVVVPFQGEKITITVSLGISRYRQNEQSIEEAGKRADRALYQAKTGGRNQITAMDD